MKRVLGMENLPSEEEVAMFLLFAIVSNTDVKKGANHEEAVDASFEIAELFIKKAKLRRGK
jgi:hypothetical protein